MEREEKEKVKKREKKLEDEETLQQATWVKYTFPIKHQVCRKCLIIFKPHMQRRNFNLSYTTAFEKHDSLLCLMLVFICDHESSSVLSTIIYQYTNFVCLSLFSSLLFYFPALCKGVEAERRGVSHHRLRGLELDK